MRTSRIGMLLVALALLGVTAGAVAAVAKVSSGSDTTAPSRASTALAANYAALREAVGTQPEAAVPSNLAHGLPAGTVENARLLRTQVSRGRSWLATTDQGSICLIIELGATGCQDRAQSAQGMVEALGGAGGGPDFKDGQVLIYGVVPDGVKTATLYMKSGASQTLQVSDNAISADVMGPTDRVEYTNTTGRLVSIPAPSYTG